MEPLDEEDQKKYTGNPNKEFSPYDTLPDFCACKD